MGKFNKGDRVKALVNGSNYKIGDEFVLTADGDDGFINFDDNAGDNRIRPQKEFELLPAAASAEDKPAFKVGDRVRAIKGGHGLVVGEIYTIARYSSPTGIGRWVDLVELRSSGACDGSFLEIFFEPATLTIEAGKFYRTRDGRKVGPMESWPLGGWHADRAPVPLNGGLWNDNGMAWFDNSKDSPDLIAEWVDEPVAQDTNDETPPVAEQQVVMTLKFDATEITESIKSMLVRTKRGYGFEIARHGDYVWVDTGLHAPIAFKAANVHAA